MKRQDFIKEVVSIFMAVVALPEIFCNKTPGSKPGEHDGHATSLPGLSKAGNDCSSCHNIKKECGSCHLVGQYVKIDETCISCDACVDHCPIGAIRPGDPIYWVDANSCIGCMKCLPPAFSCPTGAILKTI